MSVTTIDTHYTGKPGIASCFLIQEGDEAAFVETNTPKALPHLLAALREAGLTGASVKHILVTHIHLDHASGTAALLEHCPNATVWAHPRAVPHLIDPTKLVASAKKVYGEEAFSELYGEVQPVDAARVRATEDDGELRWGSRTLRFLHTPGHANHHHCIVDSASKTVFTGDSFGIMYPACQRNGPFVFPTSTPTDFDAAKAIESVRRIVTCGAEFAGLTHFGVHPLTQELADSLAEQLEDYGRIVVEADASVADDDLDDHMSAALSKRFGAALASHQLQDSQEAVSAVGFDLDLNAQGLAFAVRKLRFKRKRAAQG